MSIDLSPAPKTSGVIWFTSQWSPAKLVWKCINLAQFRIFTYPCVKSMHKEFQGYKPNFFLNHSIGGTYRLRKDTGSVAQSLLVVTSVTYPV